MCESDLFFQIYFGFWLIILSVNVAGNGFAPVRIWDTVYVHLKEDYFRRNVH